MVARRSRFVGSVVAGAVAVSLLLVAPVSVPVAVAQEGVGDDSGMVEVDPVASVGLPRGYGSDGLNVARAPSVPLPDGVSDLPAGRVEDLSLGPGWSRAGGLPVSVRASARALSGVAGGVVPGVSVEAEPGAQGRVLLRVEREGLVAGARRPAAGVAVRVGYEDFEQVFGGRWSDRLRVTAYAACALEEESVDSGGCRREGVGVEVTNDVRRNRVVFTTLNPRLVTGESVRQDPPPGEAPAPPVVPEDEATQAPGEEGVPGERDSPAPPSEPGATDPAVFTAGSSQIARAAGLGAAAPEDPPEPVVYSLSGDLGGYGAVPFSTASSWQVGEGSGEFTYAYPGADDLVRRTRSIKIQDAPGAPESTVLATGIVTQDNDNDGGNYSPDQYSKAATCALQAEDTCDIGPPTDSASFKILYLLFDPRECGSNGSVAGCGLESLAVIPPLKPLKGLNLANKVRKRNKIQEAANGGQKWAYRGVARDHPGYDDALKGRVNPRNPNGTATPEQHNLGNTTDSPYTSWIRDPDVARRFAGPDGVVLRVPRGEGSPYKFEWSPDVYYEQEILIRGPVCGALICRHDSLPRTSIPPRPARVECRPLRT